jgi:radical SAM protein with 4Fe4S-binding SPASM domain
MTDATIAPYDAPTAPLPSQPLRPLWLWIDPTRDCGLKCRFCYTKRSHSTDHLSPEALRTFLDILTLSPGIAIQKLNFNWRGDPLMNPDFLKLLRDIELRQFPFPIEFHTNGTTITEDCARELVSRMVHAQLFVSIDGGNRVSHDFNRGQGTYDKALRGLDLVLRARGSSRLPRIGLFQLDLGVPDDEYDPEFGRLAAEVDEWVRIDPIHPTNGRRVRVPTRADASSPQPAASPAVEPIDRWWARDVPRDSQQPQGPCFWAGNAFFVAPNGDVSVCLLSHSNDGVLGNLHSDSLSDLLRSASTYRSEIQKLGRAAIPHCAKCRVFEGTARL